MNNRLENNISVALLLVLESKGSSPGRQGFKMSVAADGQMTGSIGGGAMEQKLVENVSEKLKNDSLEAYKTNQIHRKDAGDDQSGMICSGEQTVAMLPISQEDQEIIREVINVLQNRSTALLKLSSSEILLEMEAQNDQPFSYDSMPEGSWTYEENLGFKGTVYIIGGGHVGVALSKTMSDLNFKVKLFDNRENLNTMKEDSYAEDKTVVPYEEIGPLIPGGDRNYITIMTFGYLTDEVVVKQLLDKNYAYLGMMGSKAKIAQLFSSLEKSGIPKEKINKVHAPIGIEIRSQSPEEIAISVAAEIISYKNKKSR